MEIKVDFTIDSIDRFAAETMSLVNRDKVLFKGAEMNSVSCKPTYVGFADIGVKLLTLKDGVTHFVTVNSTNKEEVHWVTLVRNPKSEAIFEPFKRTGIYTSSVRCGVCFATGTLYVQTKLCKELSRCSDVSRAELYAYLYSIVKFVANWQANPAAASAGFGGKYDLGITVDDFVKLIPSFERQSQTFYVKDFSSEDLDSIVYSNSGCSRILDTYVAAEPMQFAIAEYGGGKHVGVVAIPVASKFYTFMIMDGQVATDHDLCMLELASDGMCTAIASCFGKDVKFAHKDTAQFYSKDKFTVLDFDSTDADTFMKSLPAWLQKWCTNLFTRGGTYAEEAMLKHLQTLGMKLSGEIAMFDPEAVKAQYVNDSYAQELYKQVHAYYDKFELKNLTNNIHGFANGSIYSMAFVGESGTGKSTAARVLPTRCGLPYVSVNFSVNIEEADLFGAMTPNPFKQTPNDPEFIWQDGIITKAIRNGYCIILEELNFARPGVLGKLNSLLDENRQIDLSNGEIVKAHPNFRIIATCNIAYEGTNRFNKALINRFDDVTAFKDLERSEAIQVIKQRTGYGNESKIAKVYDVYEALKKFADEQRIHVVVSMRQLLNIFSKGKYYKDAKDAVTRIMLNGAFLEDAEYQATFEDTVLPAFDLKFKI